MNRSAIKVKVRQRAERRPATQPLTVATPPDGYSTALYRAAEASLRQCNQHYAVCNTWANVLRMVRQEIQEEMAQAQAEWAAKSNHVIDSASRQAADRLQGRIDDYHDMIVCIDHGPDRNGGVTGDLERRLIKAGVAPLENQTDIYAGRLWLVATEARLAELKADRKRFERTMKEFGH